MFCNITHPHLELLVLTDDNALVLQACDLKPGSVELLMQRAHLYESCEKIKLGIADLREVLKIQPGHRLASQTLARLEKML